MTLAVALRLGRVSNLPTVWTNALAGMALAGGLASPPVTLTMLVALSLFYVGGMYLNDAFDRRIDAAERPERPIPAGEVAAATVFTAGFAMLAGALALLAGVAAGWRLPLAGLLLALCILLYDWHHKGSAAAPLIMGLCRGLVYVVAALAVAPALPVAVLLAALVTLSYVVGITFAARQEALDAVESVWPLAFLAAPVVYGLLLAVDQPWSVLAYLAFLVCLGYGLWLLAGRRQRAVSRAVAMMLAGLCLLDAMYIAGAGRPLLALLAAAAFPLTLALQRRVPAT